MIRKLALTAISGLLVASCAQTDETAAQASWAEDQAAANLEEINTLRDQVSTLESRIDDLEQKDRYLESGLDGVSGQADRMADQVSYNAKVFNEHLDVYAAHRHY